MKKDEKKNKNIEKSRIMNFKDVVVSLKTIAALIMAISIITTICVTVLSVLTTGSILSSTKEELLENESTVEYISKINTDTMSEAREYILDMDDPGFFVFDKVILPSIIVVVAFILLIVLSKKMLDFLKDAKSNKTLFTTDKLYILKNIRYIFLVIGLLFILGFNFTFLIFFLVLEILLEFILYLFNYCVSIENNNDE